MKGPEFDAFSLPSGCEAEELALLAYEEPGVRVRYVDGSPGWLADVCEVLLAGRDRLLSRSVDDVVRALGRTGARFSDPEDPIRAEALELLPGTSALSVEMATVVLDGMSADWTGERLAGLVRAELGDGTVLDGFVRADPPRAADRGGTRVMAVGPSLCVQIVAGSVPGVGVTALLRSLLLKGPTLLKPGRGDVVLPVLFANALRETDAELADALAVVYWPGGDVGLEDAALARGDVVVAYGSDVAVADLRTRTPVTTRFVGYHHRVSVGVVGRDALTEGTLQQTAVAVADASALFDQRGCVSPQVVYVEGEEDAAVGFAEALADRFRLLEERLPSGRLTSGEASTVHQLRGTAELLSARGVRVMHGGDAPWTIVVELGAGSVGPGAGRAVRVRPVAHLDMVPGLLAPLGAHLQTVGAAGLGARLEDFARACARAGVSRVVSFPDVGFPPPWWHHDGGGPLRDLVRWVDLETR